MEDFECFWSYLTDFDGFYTIIFIECTWYLIYLSKLFEFLHHGKDRFLEKFFYSYLS